jgi:hypothetical protein
MTTVKVFPKISRPGWSCAVFFTGLCCSLAFAASASAEPFGVRSFEVSATNQPTPEQLAKHEPGSPDLQAGSHPYAFTTSFVMSEGQETDVGGNAEFLETEGLKDAQVMLPPGFVGNPTAVPTCPYHLFQANSCPNDTAVGVATMGLGQTSGYESTKLHKTFEQVETVSNALYNLEPPGGVASELGVMVAKTSPVILDSSVRTGGDYGITAASRKITEAVIVRTVRIKVWGVPASPAHNPIRGNCLQEGTSYKGEEESGVPHNEEDSNGECPVNIPARPFLTNPVSCGQPREATLSVDGWNNPGDFATGEHVISEIAALPPLTGCEYLDFSPTITVRPDGSAGSTPTGLNLDVRVPQESTSNQLGLGEADVRDTTVTLPAGVQISAAAADGLQACSLTQIGLDNAEKPSCPNAAKLATVHIATPLLEHELEGAVYLAAPQNFAGIPENPFSSLIAMYLVAEEPETGVLIKLAGKVEPNPVTGQLTTTFENTPQLPFSDLKLEFFGTDRAPLATPALCGTYATSSSFTPWSAASPAGPSEVAHPPASFQITSGPAGSPCANPLPFNPSLQSGVTNINAGSFSNLTTTLSREDGNQQIQQVTLHYPPGLSGLLSGVKLCGEAEANAGACGPESEIGETTVSVGLGGDPFSVVGGKVYITGPYDGAPFGLSIVNPAKAGPFDLQEGRPVVVRAKVEVNPITAALTVTTNTAAQGHAIPSMIEGIPLQIKHVNVNITRSGFTFNPTSCDPTQITGTIASAEGASSPVSIPFQVTNCASLKYAPKVTFSTNGDTSKQNGASLTTKVTYPNAPQGTYANVGYVKVELPKALPSRLTTLQKACLANVFEANPAACPPESKIGYAVVHTPLLPVPLEGPAIFVSHGGEAFPSLTMVLQGYGVTIDLVGTTFISKAAITSTTFKTVPDTPFSTFELVLPQGPYSALAANGNLCTQKLVIPNEWVGANGALLRQDSPLSVEGCAAAITVVGHRVKGKTATIQVKVPSAGKLVASGKGLSKASKQAKGASTLTVKLTLTSGEATALSRHKGRQLKAKINLTFTPRSGAKLKTSTTVNVG